MTNLLRGGLDVIRCPYGCPTTFAARLFFWASAERVGVLTKTLSDLPEWEEILDGLVQRFGWDGDARLADSVEHFKLLAGAMLRERMRPALEYLSIEEAEFGRHWRALNGGVFAAFAVAVTGALPHVELAEDAAETLAIIQVTVWLRLCEVWRRRPRKLVFEEDLRLLIDCAAPIGRALPMLTEELDTLSAEATGGDDLHWQYCARAVEASLYHSARLENPSRSRWAETYLWYELQLKETRRMRSLPERMRISEERAHDTVSAVDLGPSVELAFVVFNRNMKGFLSRWRWPRFASRIERACRRAGHTNLAGILISNIGVGVPGEAAVALADTIESLPPKLVIALPATPLWTQVAYEGRPNDFIRIAALLVEKIGTYNTIMGMAPMLLDGRHPSVLLGLVKLGERLTGLSVFARTELSDFLAQGLCLGGEASRGLDEVRRHDRWMAELRAEHMAAIEDLEAWIHDLEFHPLGHKHRIVTANVLHDAGYVDQAIPLLETLWSSLRPSLLPHVAIRLAPVYFAVSRFRDAARVLQIAHDHTVAFSSHVTPILRAQLQYARLRDGQDPLGDLWNAALGILDPEAIREAIVQTGSGESALQSAAMSPLAQLYLALAQLEQIRYRPGADLNGLDWIKDLPAVSAAAAERGDSYIHIHSQRAQALHLELSGTDATDAWLRVRDLCSTTYRIDPPVDSLIFPMIQAVRTHDMPSAHDAVRHADGVIGRAVAKLEDFEQAAGIELVRIDDIAQVSSRLLTMEAPYGLLRMVHELWRDPVRRMLGPSPVADDESLQQFSDRMDLNCTVVLEFINSERHSNILVATLLQAGKAPRTEVLLRLSDDLRPLAARLSTRMACWRPRRLGDPLDDPLWQVLAESIRERVAGLLPRADHIVMIEPTQYRLPWHVALAPHWPFSYATSWGSLLARPKGRLVPTTLGAVCVPRSGESDQVRTALEDSLRRSQDDARRAGMAFTSTTFADADTADVGRVLAEADVCSLLCHGLVDVGRTSVTLLLAANGALPPDNSIAAATPAGNAHQYDWRAAAKLDSSPRMILSAACSSGVKHLRGGQQCGLYSALRHRGLRTLIAPRWDIVATAVLPILDRCRALVLSGTGPAAALRLASLEAQHAGLPKWLAWSLTLEGDW